MVSRSAWAKADGLASQAAHEARGDFEAEIDRCAADREENHRTHHGDFVLKSDVKFAGAVEYDDLSALVVGTINDDRSEACSIEGHRVEPAWRGIKDQGAGRKFR